MTAEEKEIKRCASCHKTGDQVALLEISLPNYIPRDTYCGSCISVLVDDSKKSGKATQ